MMRAGLSLPAIPSQFIPRCIVPAKLRARPLQFSAFFAATGTR
jgi:hypothetical protein